MTDRVFVDTNILVYAYDLSGPPKHQRARQRLSDLWNAGSGVVSTQVLAEFFVVVTAKVAQPLDANDAHAIVRDYLNHWTVVVVDGPTLERGTQRSARTGRHLWDCLIIEAAVQAGCTTLLSEDLGDGQREDGVLIENPLK